MVIELINAMFCTRSILCSSDGYIMGKKCFGCDPEIESYYLGWVKPWGGEFSCLSWI